MASSGSGHAVVAKSMAGQSTTTPPTTEAKGSSSVSGTQASPSVASAAPAASGAPPTPRHQPYPPPAVSTSSSAHQSTAASAQPPATEAAAKETSTARATPAWSGVSAPGAAAVSAAPSGGVPASISIGAGGKADGVGVAGGQAGQLGVQSGTRSAAREPNAGYFGTGADAGILNNSSSMTSIEVAARAAAVADGVIRSDTPQQQQQQQQQQHASKHSSVAQTPATIPSATATPVTASALANTAFTNGVHHHHVHAIASAAAAQGATRTIYNGAYGVQRHQETQQMPSAGGVPVGYGAVQAELRLSFPQRGVPGSFLGLPCGDHVSRAHAQAQAQAQAHSQTHAHVEAQARAQAQMEADAHAQAQAKAKKPNGLRRGKWTTEEEEYANRLIQEFKSGLLPLTDGTTLRTFLSKLLNCDPMRISKKFVGSNCIGKQVFRRRQADMDRLQTSDIERSRSELADLERRFLERVAMTNRCKTSGEIGAKEGGRESDAMRPHQPPVVTQPWMLPPSPSPGAIPANHVTSTMGQQIPTAAPGVTLMDPARTFPSSPLASNGCRALGLSSTAGSMAVKPTPTSAATEVSPASAVASSATSAVNVPVAGSSTPKVAMNSNAIGSAGAGEVHRQTPVGSHQQPKTEHLSNYQHSLQQQQQQRGVVGSSSSSSTETGATRSDASSSTPERALAIAASPPPAPLAPVSSSFASASTSALDVSQPGSFLDVGGASTPTGSGTEAREVQCAETETGGGVDPSRIKAKQEPMEVPPTREVGLSFRNSVRVNDGTKVFNSGLLGSAGATATSAAAVLGVGIDRTTSLEALSLLELPHLQGMPNLALLGLGPALPTSSSALSLTMSLPITSAKGGTSGVGLKRTPSWARISSYENLQSLAEGFPVGPTSSGLNGTETSGSDNAGVSHGLGASSCSNTMGSGPGSGSTPAAFMPRNTSVEDFLSLVESGDIPPPEGSAGFTVPMWIYGDDGKSAEKAPARSSSNPDKGSSASSSCLISGSVDPVVAEQPRSKRLKASSAKTEAKG